jgi:hypothetical protein
MERNRKHLISYGLVLSLVAALSLVISACTSSSTSPSTQSPTPTPSVSPTVTPTETPSPTESASPSPTIEATPPVITSTSLPDGTVGSPYSQNLEATSVSGNYTWSISADFLPLGLGLNSASGTISGTPTAAATYFFDVTVTDENGASTNKSFSITVDFNPAAPPPATPTPTPTPTSTATPTATAATGAFTITTSSLPAGTVETSYSQSILSSGGTAPFIWSYWAGPLPDGLKLDASSGIIFGTPTAHGTFNFTVVVTDSTRDVAASALSIVVNTR